MPQMAPINWLSLFFIFSIIFIILNIFNYFTFILNKTKNKNFKNNKLSMNWKW
uniref:ATP synthase complex subunit 8 n=1 Tax=Trichosia lengersdorfi TaxID=1884860 RepID=A0A6G7GC54_9DIPT|nr:ATP synthase F0 subunit 8 [Trichosia lengersdorfi]QIH95793.1 ATP synthase F0 subunit 8 [Trichosia lengersdorfi]